MRGVVLIMKDSIKLYLSELKRNKTQHRKLLGVFCVLAVMVAAGVFWRLRIIGITKTAEPTCGIPEHIHSEECILSKTLICGFEDDTVDEPSEPNRELKLVCSCQPHVHTPDCFDMFGNVICGNADYIIHQHNNFCFDENGMLICTLPEILPHIHTEACYEDTSSWSCGYEEGEETSVHTHTDDCYETQSTLICNLAEDETHTHTPECYTEEKLLICTLPETEVHIHNENCAQTSERKLICGYQETALHTHTPECYDEMGNLICGQLQVIEHLHTIECMAEAAQEEAAENSIPAAAALFADGTMNPEWNCLYQSHVHTPDCFDMFGNVICGNADYIIHQHNNLCFDENGMLICTLPEILPHIHTEACYEDTSSWSCGYEEGEETSVHTHTDDCYETQSTLICNLAEDETHTHTPECYTEEKLLICTLPETEVHIHNENCAQTSERKLICGYQETALHTHTPECYDEMGNLICGQLQVIEHSHTAECLSQSAPGDALPEEDVSTLPDSILNDGQEPHVHTDECYEYIYKCGYEEHIHAILCYADYNADLETEDDWQGTIPSNAEFDGMRSDYLVQIAISQLDYAESKRNFIIDQQGIRRGYSRYGQWYNNPYGPWNTAFVSFCMHYAGISEDEIPPASGAFQMLTQLDSLGRFVPHTYEDPMGDYEPIPGDIIFIDINGDGMPDRTGIVCDVIGDRIEVIEGDVGDNDYISDGSSELYESIGGSMVSQLGLLSAEEIYVENYAELDSMQIDALLSETSVFDTAAAMPSESGYMADAGFYSDYQTAGTAFDTASDIPETVEEEVVLDGDEPLGYVWDDEAIPTHSVAKVSYEKSDNAIVGYGIVSNVEEAELYTSLGGYEVYAGDYTDLDTYTTGVAIVNVGSGSAYKALVLKDEYVEANPSDTTASLPPADKMWRIDKASWGGKFLFKLNNDFLCIDSDGDINQYIFSPNIYVDITLCPNIAFVSSEGGYKLEFHNVPSTNQYIGINNDVFITTDANNAAIFNLYTSAGDIVTNVSHETFENGNYYIATTDGKVLTPDLTADGKLESFPLRTKTTAKIDSADFNPTVGSVSALIWNFEEFTGNNDSHDFRIKSGNKFIPIQELAVDAIENFTVNSYQSKFRFIKQSNYVLINSLTGSNPPSDYYVILGDDGVYRYEKFDTPEAAAADPRTHFQLYVPCKPADNLSDYAHYYVVATRNTKVTDLDSNNKNHDDITNEHLVTVMHLYANPGEKLRLSFEDGSFNASDPNKLANLSAITKDSAIGDIDFNGVRKVDNKSYYDYVVTANEVGETVIILSSKNQILEEAQNTYPSEKIVRIELKVGGDIKDTFRKGKINPYHHLDVEVEANFKIKIYNEDPTAKDDYIMIEPTDIEVVDVYAKVYNTGALVGNVWNKDYMRNPGANKSGRPTWNPGNYVNPWEKTRKYNNEKGQWEFTETDNIFWDSFEFGMTAPKRNGTQASSVKPYGGYTIDDTYNGSTVDSVTITYNESEVQPNGQLEFLTYGWGWTQFYDGDTAELYCVIKYEYQGKTYKANYVVTRLICDTNNVCPSAFDYENVIHGFDIDVIIDDIIEVESNELVKVDQYGNGVPGAEFDFYPADKDYVVTGGAVSALHVKTDENGRFQFTKTNIDDGGKAQTTILSLREFKNYLNSNYFVMREASTPDGYRSIPKEAHLFFEGSVNDGGKELFVQCANPFESGVIANASANVIAPGILKKAGTIAGETEGNVTYYDIDDNGDFHFEGDLYAVVLKRNGANPGIKSVNQITLQEWSPVYGDDLTGYTVVKPDIAKGEIAANIVKDLIKNNKGVYKLEPNITGRFCSASVSNLPGQLTRYYTYMYNMRKDHQLTQEDLNNLEYIVSYYFVPYDENGNPNVDGAFRINSHDVDTGNEFKIHWATTIEAPNFTNNLYFQKTNANGDLLDDAYFALYNAVEVDGKTYLVGADGKYYDLQPPTISNQSSYEGVATIYNSGKTLFAQNCKYIIDCTADGTEANGMIDKDYIGQVRVTDNANNTHYINPVPRTDDTSKSFVGYTHSAHTSVDGNTLDCITASAQGGTGHFVRLCEGEYVLMEIKPPAGYDINPAKVKVRVTDKGVFANAGTKEDGIVVAKGVGYLAETMTSFASRRNINESLTWIAVHLNINPDDSYKAVEEVDGWTFASPANETYNGKTHRAYKALYRGEKVSTSTRDTAMVTYLVYDPNTRNYTDSSGLITTNRKLFEYAVNLGENPSENPTDKDYENGQFERTSITKNVNGNDIKTNETGEGTGTLRLYTDIGWSFLSVFQDSGYALQEGIRNPTSLYNDLTTNNDRLQYLFSNATYVQVTDPISVGLTVVKEGKDSADPDNPDNNKPLADAQFKIYKTVGEGDDAKQYYYKVKQGIDTSKPYSSNDVEWTENASEATVLTSAFTDDKTQAIFRVYGLGIGKYTLIETKPPDGYTCASPQTIEIKVENGVLKFYHNGEECTQLVSGDSLYDVSLGYSEIQQYSITVVDDNGLQLNIRKVEAEKTDLLAGAEFILYKKVVDVNGMETTYYYSQTGTEISWTDVEDDAAKLPSTGDTPISISGISPGKYYLREIKAPPGYYALTSDIEITVSDENVVTVNNGTGVTCERDNTSTEGVIIYNITVPNTTGYALPETGGMGAEIYTYSGIILMLAALALFVIKKPLVSECVRRRCERRTEK